MPSVGRQPGRPRACRSSHHQSPRGPNFLADIIGLQLDAKFVAVLCTVMFAGFLRGFVGFGAALIVVPVLSLVYGPIIAVPASILLALPATAQLLPDAIRYSEPRFVLPVSIPVFAAAPVGVWGLASVDPAIMKIVISSMVVVMVILLLRGWKLSHAPGWVVLSVAGAAGGVIQGAAGIGGPPVVAVALSRAGPVSQQRANVVGVMTAVSLASFIPLWHFDLLGRQAMELGLLLFAPNMLATWFGARYFSRSGQGHYRIAALSILGIIGVSTLGAAIMDYLQT